MKSNKQLFIFGLGYFAKHLITILQKEGWHIAGTCRSQEKVDAFHRNGVAAVLLEDASEVKHLEPLAQASHILVTIAPDAQGCPVYHAYGKQIRHCQRLQWFAYLSSTSVYGDHQGQWVDETSPCLGTDAVASARLLAEQQWLQLGIPVHIFRLAGIYGEGRNRIESLQQQRCRHLVKPGHYMSRMHIVDMCRVVKASMQMPQPGEIYNCADDVPCSSSEVLNFIAKRCDIVLPAAENVDEVELSPMLTHFYSNNRRVANDKIKRVFGLSLLFSSYKDGYEDIISHMEGVDASVK